MVRPPKSAAFALPSFAFAAFAALTAITLTFGGLGACAKNGAEVIATVTPPGVDAGDSGDQGGLPPCGTSCSADGRSITDTCTGAVLTACAPTTACGDGACVDACKLADQNKASVGCDYYAVNMDIHTELAGSCFVAFVTNTFGAAAHVQATFDGAPLDLAKYAKRPKGEGKDITYEPYDVQGGLPPGEVAILFLANFGGVACPVPAARTTGAWVSGTGYTNAFHVTTDVPVVAYQMLPYGGGSAAITGATLLLPTSVWGTNYVAVNAYSDLVGLHPSLDIVAAEDDTTVEILPRVDIQGRAGLVDGGKAGTSVAYTLKKGEVLQLSQTEELTGSPIVSSKKFAVFGGHQCMNVPADVGYCDHAEQQIPPVRALGNSYVAVPPRPRIDGMPDRALFRLVGAVAGTKLTYDPPTTAGPDSIALGEMKEIWSDAPFVVTSQDDAHPFMLFEYMTGGANFKDYGDPDFVRVVTPSQYLSRYVFYTDPTYPETNLVVIRKRAVGIAGAGGGFADVTLDCAGVLTGWTPLSSDYEWTRTDLVRHDFAPQGRCNNGVREMHSTAPFGLTVWGWGGPETQGGVCDGKSPRTFTCDVSYAYAAGESVKSLNTIIVGPPPR